ncbi:MAG TPA: hypothetical protein VHM30_02370, partial [Gemmatimonadaceae bacterium]|nr:hypothetical protein [Gemmatimonadaceae bacterium]
MQIFVTGATGVVGRRAVPLLVAAGWVVPLVGFGLVPMLAGGALLLAGFALAAVRIARPADQVSLASPSSPGLT